MNPGIIDVAPCVKLPAQYRVGDTVTRIFERLTIDIFISNFISTVINQKYFKTSTSSKNEYFKNMNILK